MGNTPSIDELLGRIDAKSSSGSKRKGKANDQADSAEDEKARKDAEHAEAMANTAALEASVDPDDVADAPDPESGSLIHIVGESFIAFGRVWYRGQEIDIPDGGDLHQQTFDRNGKSWLDQTEADQIRSWGEVKWRRGPWPYERAITSAKPTKRAAPRM